jgi:hypothetical protein
MTKTWRKQGGWNSALFQFLKFMQLSTARFRHVIRFDRRSIIASTSQNVRYWPKADIAQSSQRFGLLGSNHMAKKRKVKKPKIKRQRTAKKSKAKKGKPKKQSIRDVDALTPAIPDEEIERAGLGRLGLTARDCPTEGCTRIHCL